ncbi:hypothetical protein [Clostridium sp. BSD9I1]|uniref:hypothetical protein n=1 Tax=Clostridium sp. BSD9I1 TaxID=2003589 RepID=UPI0016477327|nr:hypothetical protein [Clostridium sp. BSD9I1]
MKRFRVFISAFSIIFLFVLIARKYSYDSVVLYKAFNKTEKVNSMKSDTDIILRVSGENMTEKEKEDFQSLLPMLSMLKLSLDTNSAENDKNTGMRIESDINAKFKAMSFHSKVWIDNDFAEEQTRLEAVISRPSLFNIIEINSKNSKAYIKMEFNKMNDKNNVSLPNHGKMLNSSSYSHADFFDFINKYIKEADSSSNKIEKVAIESTDEHNGEEHVDIYNIQLDDKVTKFLLSDIVSNLKKDKDTVEFIKRIKDSFILLPELKVDSKNEDKKEFYKAINVIHDNIPLYCNIIVNILDNIDTFNINEERGIKLRCGVNSKGYLVSESIILKLKIDLSNMKNLINNEEEKKYTGVYTINIEFNNKLNNINEGKKIDFPVLNKENCIDYFKWTK